MRVKAFQITSLTIVYSTIYSDADQRKHQSSTSLAFGKSPLTGEFPAQMASNAENVSIWWCHHFATSYDMFDIMASIKFYQNKFSDLIHGTSNYVVKGKWQSLLLNNLAVNDKILSWMCQKCIMEHINVQTK